MSDHKFVINRKTKVVFARNPSLDQHPDCVPYWPERPAPTEPVEVAIETRKPRGKASAGKSAAAAAAAAAAEAEAAEQVAEAVAPASAADPVAPQE